MTFLQSILASLKAGAWKTAVAALIGIAVTVGVFTTDQASALQNVLDSVGALVTIVLAAAHTFKGAKQLRAGLHPSGL